MQWRLNNMTVILYAKCVNFKHDLVIDILSIQVNITLESMPEDLVDTKWTLVQVLS